MVDAGSTSSMGTVSSPCRTPVRVWVRARAARPDAREERQRWQGLRLEPCDQVDLYDQPALYGARDDDAVPDGAPDILVVDVICWGDVRATRRPAHH